MHAGTKNVYTLITAMSNVSYTGISDLVHKSTVIMNIASTLLVFTSTMCMMRVSEACPTAVGGVVKYH